MSYPAPIFSWHANSKQLHPLMAFSRASQATEIDGSGLLRTVNAGVPRFEHDPLTGICKGLLVEPSVTFLDTNSEQLDSASWAKNHLSVTPNATTAPDGATTADKLYEDTAATAQHAVWLPNYSATNVTLTGQVCVKAAERTQITIYVSNGTTHFLGASFDLATGLFIAQRVYGSGDYSGLTYTIEKLPGGYYLISITLNKSAVNSNNIFTIELMKDSNANYTGDGVSGLYIWGAKFYAGTGPTSYLPTTAAGVTRAADLCTVDVTQLKRNGNALWSGKEGTLVVEFQRKINVQAGSYPGVCSLNTDSSNRISILLNGDSQTVGCSARNSSGWQASLIAGAFAKGSPGKVAFAFASSDFATAMNGTIGQKSTSGVLPSVTTLNVGFDGISNYLNGTVKSLKLYNRRIADADLVALSSL